MKIMGGNDGGPPICSLPFWITGADSREWEIYTVLADAPASVQSPASQPTESAPSCCGPATSA